MHKRLEAKTVTVAKACKSNRKPKLEKQEENKTENSTVSLKARFEVQAAAILSGSSNGPAPENGKLDLQFPHRLSPGHVLHGIAGLALRTAFNDLALHP